MVDVSKVKSRLGRPPESGAVKGNLKQPEENALPLFEYKKLDIGKLGGVLWW
jgi:hypothetical protein